MRRKQGAFAWDPRRHWQIPPLGLCWDLGAGGWAETESIQRCWLEGMSAGKSRSFNPLEAADELRSRISTETVCKPSPQLARNLFLTSATHPQ